MMGSRIQFLHMSRMRCDRRFAPQSDSRTSGTPNTGMTSVTNNSAMRLVFWSGIGSERPFRSVGNAGKLTSTGYHYLSWEAPGYPHPLSGTGD